MIQFKPSEPRFFEDSIAVPFKFLSLEIQNAIEKRLNFTPSNVYMSNAAGDYIFITIVNDKQVFTFTDSYNLNEEFRDYERVLNKSLWD